MLFVLEYLTLTSVVFELWEDIILLANFPYLTLTSVVFECLWNV